jgi:hypothetical protein
MVEAIVFFRKKIVGPSPMGIKEASCIMEV